MKRFIKTMCVLTILAGLSFSANSRILKSDINMKKMKRVEPDYRNGASPLFRGDRDHCAPILPNNVDAQVVNIDSSSNGYGMWSTVTRPMDVNSDGNMLVIYRQYAGENTTHGQLGAGYGVVGDGLTQWDVQYNVNYNGNPPWGGGGVGGENTAQARYPSGIASEEYPYAIWNEYTGNVPGWPADCSSYGGRPYFSYDEFGWGGESWLYPAELDPLYDCSKDLWVGSVGYGYNELSGEHHVSVVYEDWTRTGSWLFTSEAVEDGYIVLGTETLIINPQHIVEDYTSYAILSMNNNGEGLLGVDGFFEGYDPVEGTCVAPAANLICDFKTPMFKLTDDYGLSWRGNHGAFDLYYVPEAVFENIMSTWPTEDVDACTGETNALIKVWSWYNFDMRVDANGNPHIVVTLIPESEQYLHILKGYSGFYHFTIDKDCLLNDGTGQEDLPGCGGAMAGWEWSFIPLPAENSLLWNAQDGDTYAWQMMGQLSISRDDDNIIYVVSNIGTLGDMNPEWDTNNDENEDDPCGIQDYAWELYPEFSEDIWVAKSTDNGASWTSLQNITKTPKPIDDPTGAAGNNQFFDVGWEDSCSPEEMFVHTAHWSYDDRVYFQYQQPNWHWNEIGDLNGADYMNRVMLGYSFVEDQGIGGCMDATNCSYNANAEWDDGSCAGTGGSGINLGDCAAGGQYPGMTGCDCLDVCNGSADLDCNNVCNGYSVSACNAYDGDTTDGNMTDPLFECIIDATPTVLTDNIQKCDWDTAWDCSHDPDHAGCHNEFGVLFCDDISKVNYWDACDNTPCGDDHPAVDGCAGSFVADNAGCTDVSGLLGVGGSDGVCDDSSPWFPNNCDNGRCSVCSLQGSGLDGVNGTPASTAEDGADCTIPCTQEWLGFEDCSPAQSAANCVADELGTGNPVCDCEEICTSELATDDWGPTYAEPGTGADCNPSAWGDVGCVDLILTKADCDAANGFWYPFVDNGWDMGIGEEWSDGVESGGNPAECYCSAEKSQDTCYLTCGADLGDVDQNGQWNVLDIVILSVCILGENCADLESACAGDINGSGGDNAGVNVLDIVQLALCILAVGTDESCENLGSGSGRMAGVNDASESRLITRDNHMYIEANGYIGGVQMTLYHGSNFNIEMTDRALIADYLTSGNQTRLLVISPETDELFSYSGDFEIAEIIVANSYAEVSVVELPVADRFSLGEAYPNPFNPTTTIDLFMLEGGDVQVEVYNLLGQTVETLTSGYKEMGTYQLIWDATAVASGVYFVKAETGGVTKIQKLMLIK